MRVGLVGYSKQKFDESEALACIKQAFDYLEESGDYKYALVSGLTDLGIPGIGYREADRRGWYLIGVACHKAKEYNCYPVHKEIFVGNNWGDESERFINEIDILIRVGGGEQSLAEVAMAHERGIMTMEFDLEAHE